MLDYVLESLGLPRLSLLSAAITVAVDASSISWLVDLTGGIIEHYQQVVPAQADISCAVSTGHLMCY